MATVPVVPAVGNRSELLLQIELARILAHRADAELKKEELKLRIMEMEHKIASVAREATTRSCQATHVHTTNQAQECVVNTSVEIDSKPLDMTSRVEGFDVWLRTVRDRFLTLTS